MQGANLETYPWSCVAWLDSETPITLAEPRVRLQVAGKSVSFFLGHLAYFLRPALSFRSTTPPQILVMGIEGTPSVPRLTKTLFCSLDHILFTHSCLIIPSCSVPLLGQNVLSHLGASIQLAGI